MKKIITQNENETKKLAKALAAKLSGGEVIGLIGDLGTGKTVFVKGLAQGLGIKRTINSPTFVLMKVYKIKKHQTLKNLVHIDAYRLKSAVSLEEIGINDYLYQDDSVVVIEWADKVRKLLGNIGLIINMESIDDKKRRISIK